MSEDRLWTVGDLLRWTTSHFAERGIETPRLDAECLLACALGTDRLRLYLDHDMPVEQAERARFRGLVQSRSARRVPVAQLTGEKEFWSLRLAVTGDVLVPRPETETVVAVALELFPDRDAELHILDLGTGSGAIALALAGERPKARVTATDVSGAALAVAAGNAERLGLAGRIRLLEGSLFEPVRGERFDLLVSNPPYLAEPDAPGLAPELAHEPRQALFAGSDGYAVLRPLVAGAAEALEPDGAAVIEVASGQTEAVAGWLRSAGFPAPRVHRDLAERPRVVAARRG